MRLRNVLGFFSGILAVCNSLKQIFVPGWGGFISVLMCHDVSPSEMDVFERHIRYLSRHYNFIDMHTFRLMMTGQCPLRGKNLLLTFDDGFKSDSTVAKDILDPLGIKALFFIPPDFIDTDRTQQNIKKFVAQYIYEGNICEGQVPQHLQPMDWEDIRMLVKKGHTIGAHTCRHVRLSTVADQKTLVREIVDSGDRLQERLNIPITTFAYPFGTCGSVDENVLRIAQRRYEFVFSGVRGHNNRAVHPLAIRREAVAVSDSLRYWRFIVEGGLAPYYHYNRKQLDAMVPQ